jgi:glycosyltransferase involved in cell wall biosynthesis
MKLSIVIPCFNELDSIEKVVQAVTEAPGPDREIKSCSKKSMASWPG